MKKLFTLTLAICMSLVGFAQATFCGKLFEENLTADEVLIKVTLEGNEIFGLGTSNFVLSFDPTVVENPQFVENFLVGGYQPVSVSNPDPGILSVNIELGLDNMGHDIQTTITDIMTFKMDIVDPNAQIEINWEYNGGSTETVIYDEDNDTQLIATSAGCLEDISLAPLPVELTAFNARKSGQESLLSWKTAAEINLEKFIVERSSDAASWETIKEVAPRGSVDRAANYHIIDNDPKTGINYYRLKMMDTDRSIAYSEIKSLNFGGIKDVMVYPNPTSESVEFVYDQKFKIRDFRLINSVGKLVMQNATIDGPINVSHLEPGIYIAELTFNNDIVVKKILVERAK